MNTDEQKMRQIAEQVFSEKTGSGQFASFNIQNHAHNRTDSTPVNQVDLVPSNKYILTVIFPAGSGTEVFSGVANPTSIAFYGIATSGPNGGRASVNGIAYLGPCYSADGANLSLSQSTNIIQASNGLSINTSNVNTAHTSFSSLYFAYAEDNTSAVVASMKVVRFDNQSVTVQIAVATNWQLVGSIFIV